MIGYEKKKNTFPKKIVSCVLIIVFFVSVFSHERHMRTAKQLGKRSAIFSARQIQSELESHFMTFSSARMAVACAPYLAQLLYFMSSIIKSLPSGGTGWDEFNDNWDIITIAGTVGVCLGVNIMQIVSERNVKISLRSKYGVNVHLLNRINHYVKNQNSIITAMTILVNIALFLIYIKFGYSRV